MADANPGFNVTGPVCSFAPANSGLTFLEMPRSFAPIGGRRPTSEPSGLTRLGVAAGLAERCEVQLAYAIGVAEPVSVLVDTFGTEKVDASVIPDVVRKNFQLTPRGIMDSLNLRRPIYRKTAAYGHFGRNDPDFTWEKTDKASKLATDAGLKAEPVGARK